MSRRSSHGAAPARPADLPRLAELCGFEATDSQLRARTQFWVIHRRNPLVDPSHMTGPELARELDIPEMAKWWTNPSFRSWFLKREEWREDAEFSLTLLLREVSRRLRQGRVEMEATKDLIGLAKALGELAGKVGRAVEEEARTGAQLSEAEANKLIEQAARAKGFVHISEIPGAQLPSAPAAQEEPT